MMQRIESWDVERIEKVKEAIGPVYEELLKVQEVIDTLQDPVQNLIESYAFVGSQSEETTEL
jgi:tRNA nucleotidyltransferase (CCA-adding enzyme)